MNNEYTPSICPMIWAGIWVLFASVIGFCLAAGVIWSMAFFKSLIFG